MNKLFCLFAIAVAAVACTRSDGESFPEPNSGDAGRLPVSICGHIQKMTRAYDASWNANDAIGVYLTYGGTSDIAEEASNYRYVTAAGDGRFAPSENPVMIPADAEGSYDLIAYYPYGEVAEGVLSLSLADQKEQGPIDLLSARFSGVDKDGLSAELQFSHKLTKLMLRISSETFKFGTLKATIADQITDVRYSVLSGELAAGSSDRKTVVLRNFGLSEDLHSIQAEAILLPNMPGNEAADRMLQFEIGGQVYTACIAASTLFEGGKKYLYQVDIQASGDMVIVGAGIADWTEAPGDDPVTIPRPGIQDVYFMGSANGWGQTLLEKQSDGTALWKGFMDKGNEVKFTLQPNGNMDTYQLMSAVAGLEFDLGNPMPISTIYYVNGGIDNKWKSPQDGYYTVSVDIAAMTVTFTRDGDGWFAVGDATPGGWTTEQAVPMLPVEGQPGVFSAEMQLNKGELKFLCGHHFEGLNVQAPAENTPFAVGVALQTKTTDTGDNKWIVSEEQGGKKYRLTLNMNDHTLTAVEVD